MVRSTNALKTAWRSFRDWRRARPFGGGACTLFAGIAVLFPPFASFKLGDAVITLNTLGGISASVIGVVLVICGLAMWIRPQFRLAAGIIALLVSLAAIPAANLGSFLIATLFGVIGAALGISWSPKSRQQAAATRRGKRARRRRAGSADSADAVSSEEQTDQFPVVQAAAGSAGGDS